MVDNKFPYFLRTIQGQNLLIKKTNQYDDKFIIKLLIKMEYHG
jgi:hypothetical protein